MPRHEQHARLSLTFYDGSSAGGNCLVTQTKAYKDSSTDHTTSYAYDVRGQVWKSTSHKIDGLDGSDDDKKARALPGWGSTR